MTGTLTENEIERLFDATTVIEECPRLPYEVPAWVPSLIAEVAPGIAARDPFAGRPEMRALLTDRRMRAVWDQLRQRRRSDGGYLYPVEKLPWNPGERIDVRQSLGLLELFKQALGLALQVTVTGARMQRRDESEGSKKFAEIAIAVLHGIRAGIAASTPPPSWDGGVVARQDAEDARILTEAEAVIRRRIETMARVVESAGFVVERDRGTAQAQWFAVSLVDVCRTIFDRELFTVVAIITKVLFRVPRSFSAATVRMWCTQRADHRARAAAQQGK
jgi:hypothetical protein